MADTQRVYEILDIVDKQIFVSADSWIQGEFEMEGCYCLVGAVCEVAGQRAFRPREAGRRRDNKPIPNWMAANAPGLNFALAELAVTVDDLGLRRGIDRDNVSVAEAAITGWQDRGSTTFEDIKRVLALTKERLWDELQHQRGQEA